MRPTPRRASNAKPIGIPVPAALGKIQVTIELVGPGEAQEMLGHNDSNRSMSPATWMAYAEDMRNEDWAAQALDPIRVAADGTLLDGQHRLKAIVESGKPQYVLLVRGLDPMVQDKIDAGRPRRFSDILKLRREKRYTAIAAITRRVVFWEKGVRTRGNASGRATNSVLDKALADNPDIRFSAEVASATKSHVSIPESILGFCHLLFARIDADDCQFFFDSLRAGVAPAADHPIAVLLRTTAQSKGDNSRLTETNQLAYMIKAWNAFRAGETVSRLTYRPGGAKPEPFPEPK